MSSWIRQFIAGAKVFNVASCLRDYKKGHAYNSEDKFTMFLGGKFILTLCIKTSAVRLHFALDN